VTVATSTTCKIASLLIQQAPSSPVKVRRNRPLGVSLLVSLLSFTRPFRLFSISSSIFLQNRGVWVGSSIAEPSVASDFERHGYRISRKYCLTLTNRIMLKANTNAPIIRPYLVASSTLMISRNQGRVLEPALPARSSRTSHLESYIRPTIFCAKPFSISRMSAMLSSTVRFPLPRFFVSSSAGIMIRNPSSPCRTVSMPF
jgi:hypothetical protein